MCFFLTWYVLDPTHLPDLFVRTSSILVAFFHLLKTQNADAMLLIQPFVKIFKQTRVYVAFGHWTLAVTSSFVAFGHCFCYFFQVLLKRFKQNSMN